jgi:hypothetical protein
MPYRDILGGAWRNAATWLDVTPFTLRSAKTA